MERYFLHLVELLPALAGRGLGEHGIGEAVVDDTLGLAVEDDLLVEALYHDTETEYLTQRAEYLERRAGTLLAHAGQQEVLVVVRGALRHLGQFVRHGLGFRLGDYRESRAVRAALEDEILGVDDLSRVELYGLSLLSVYRGYVRTEL